GELRQRDRIPPAWIECRRRSMVLSHRHDVRLVALMDDRASDERPRNLDALLARVVPVDEQPEPRTVEPAHLVNDRAVRFAQNEPINVVDTYFFRKTHGSVPRRRAVSSSLARCRRIGRALAAGGPEAAPGPHQDREG